MLRLTSWADPFSAAAEDENAVNPMPGIRREQSYTVPPSPVHELPVSITIDDWDQLEEKRLRLLQRWVYLLMYLSKADTNLGGTVLHLGKS
jgi:hypothetical protein